MMYSHCYKNNNVHYFCSACASPAHECYNMNANALSLHINANASVSPLHIEC